MILPDGFGTLIFFELQPGIKIYETEITLPEIDTGEPIPQDTMRSVEWGMKAFQKLKEMNDGNAVYAYDPADINKLNGMVGKNQRCTVILPDAFTIRFWGGMRNAKFATYQKGVRPTLSTIIVCTNRDGNGAESGPVYGY